MFGLFTKKNTDIVMEATQRAIRETREDVAIEKFLRTLDANQPTVNELRETYRATIDELCDKNGIRDLEKRRSIHRQMFAVFSENLRISVREYLRDQYPSRIGTRTVN